ncbi:MAG: ATP-binding cassette domain-containing protein [candidate division Zixibacteria bacterium]|nr:ATP-binding cassette domain-containing protein [candidate division Zixibacteria bacterium]MDH3938348.1 ATP-binding cassette domain-containing protein [candidate division Zixibacteria bacterium]MDH4034693.1 ATP-binding cassette domain-containing protein [candidate division Zixibacteria bacterium]
MQLKLENISKSYGDTIAVDKLTLEVPRGVIYGIIGPNGAGKTTTIRMVMNITVPDSGSVLVDGEPVGHDFTNRVGYLPEERGLYKKMTVLEIIRYLAQLKGYASGRAQAEAGPWLARMDLSDYRDRKVEELSKGMQQKLQFITTILHRPDLIILDELFSGLDPLNIELIKDIILELKREGKTILFSTHVMEQAEKLCDHVCMISKGKKVIDGSMADVKARFGTNSVQIDMDGDGHFLKGLSGVKHVREFNNYLELELDDSVNCNDLLKLIADRVTVRRFEMVEPSLYSIFIETAKTDPTKLESPQGDALV